MRTLRQCESSELEDILKVINDGARAYAGVIPSDCLHTPYMSLADLQREIDREVAFWGVYDDAVLAGVMGLQHVQNVTLIRHAYVRTVYQGQGIGAMLLEHLRQLTPNPILIGAWADAAWAIHFYQRHGFHRVSSKEKDLLLATYWTVSPRQVQTSVVLVDDRWLARQTSLLPSS